MSDGSDLLRLQKANTELEDRSKRGISQLHERNFSIIRIFKKFKHLPVKMQKQVVGGSSQTSCAQGELIPRSHQAPAAFLKWACC